MSRLQSIERRADDLLSGTESDTEEELEPRTEDDADEGTNPVATAPLFRLGRILFGGVLAFNAIDNLRNLEGRIAYAEAKGAPYPEISVPALTGGLLAGSIGIALWRLPTAAAAGVAGFLASVTPVMHDFWNAEDEEKQNETIHFLKNTALLGAALALLGLGRKSD